MSEEIDGLVDKAIEAEKLRALQRYRLHPISLRPTAPEESAVRWMPLGKHKLASACVALLVLSLLVVLRYERQSSTAGVTSQTIERALSAANTAQQELVSAGISSPGVHEVDSDTVWTIQRAFCRTLLLQYSAQDRGTAVLRAFSNVQAPPRPAVAWAEGAPPGFARRMEQLASTNAVGRVLSGLQR